MFLGSLKGLVFLCCSMRWILLIAAIVSLCVGLSPLSIQGMVVAPTIQTSSAQQQDDSSAQQQDGSSDETSVPPPVSGPFEEAKEPPIANAGPDQSVRMGAIVTLDGTESFDLEGRPLAYSWTQTSGPEVTLNDPTSVRPNFTSPDVVRDNTTLTFSLEVNNGRRGSDADMVSIIVMPPQ
jgi:K319-like protein